MFPILPFGMTNVTGNSSQNPVVTQPDLSANNDSDLGAGLLGNFDDEKSWQNYIDLLGKQNLFNSAEAEKTRNWNQMMRDTEVSSYMKQLEEAGINPLLAVNGGFSGSNYSSNTSAQAYSGTSPYSNSSRVDASIIRALGTILGNVINGAVKLGSLYFR